MLETAIVSSLFQLEDHVLDVLLDCMRIDLVGTSLILKGVTKGNIVKEQENNL